MILVLFCGLTNSVLNCILNIIESCLKVLGRLFLSKLIPKTENNEIYIQSDKRYFGYRREKIAFNKKKEKKFGNQRIEKNQTVVL